MRTHSLVPRLFLMSIMAALTAVAWADDGETEVQLADSPAPVQKTLLGESKGGVIDATLTKDTQDGKSVYWASVTIGGVDYDFGVDEDGTLREKTLQLEDDEVDFSDCPAAVQKTLREESKKTPIDTVTKERKLGTIVYAAQVAIEGKSYSISVAEDGTLTEKVLQIEEDEITFKDCPAAVRKTLRSESNEAAVETVIKSGGFGQPVYSADVVINGKTYYLEVTADGTLTSKILQDDEEE